MGELYNPYPKLPKNIRQIGERDQIVKLYVEDYVNTYLRRLYPTGGNDLRCGLLLGSEEEDQGMPYIFIDGALEMEGVTGEGEQVEFTELSWKRAYQNMEEMFPKRSIQGWFLCGVPGCQLSPLNYWKQHSRYFPGKNMIMYLNSGLEGEEALYIASEDGFYKLRGYSIYYERNQMMQDYMISRKDIRRVDADASDVVIRDFRRKMEEKKEEAQSRKSTVSVLGGICGALSVAVLASGIVMFNNYQKMKEMESVIASALPAGTNLWQDYQLGDDTELIFETGSTVQPETMAPEIVTPEPETAAAASVPETQEATTEMPMAAPEESTEAAADQPVQTEAVEPRTEIPTLEEAETQMAEVGEAAAAANTYIVGEGETLYGICFKIYHDLSQVDRICELNGLDDVNKIKAGQKLLLP